MKQKFLPIEEVKALRIYVVAMVVLIGFYTYTELSGWYFFGATTEKWTADGPGSHSHSHSNRSGYYHHK